MIRINFSRLIERLKKVGCSFVSVTQSFNTTGSMSGLTLSILFFFAQFELESTAKPID